MSFEVFVFKNLYSSPTRCITSDKQEWCRELGVVIKNQAISILSLVKGDDRLVTYQITWNSRKFDYKSLSGFIFNINFIYQFFSEVPFFLFGFSNILTVIRLSPSSIMISETVLGGLNLSIYSIISNMLSNTSSECYTGSKSVSPSV